MKDLEIEKKYLVKSLDEVCEYVDLEGCKKINIEQGYLSCTPTIRVRKYNDEYCITYKSRMQSNVSEDLIVNKEIELPLTEESYNNIIDLRKFYNKLEPVKTPGALKEEMDFYEPEEFFKFISVVDDLRYKCFFELLYYCGLRRSEARGLQWKHIDFKTIIIHTSILLISFNPSNSFFDK